MFDAAANNVFRCFLTRSPPRVISCSASGERKTVKLEGHGEEEEVVVVEEEKQG
jgi:hypothetical protein